MEVLFGWLLSWLELLVFSLTAALVELAAEEDDCDDTAAEDHAADEGRGVKVLAAVTLGWGRRWFRGGRRGGRVTGARRFFYNNNNNEALMKSASKLNSFCLTSGRVDFRTKNFVFRDTFWLFMYWSDRFLYYKTWIYFEGLM